MEEQLKQVIEQMGFIRMDLAGLRMELREIKVEMAKLKTNVFSAKDIEKDKFDMALRISFMDRINEMVTVYKND